MAILNHEYSLFELLPYVISVLLKVISSIFSYRYSLGVARNLDATISASNINDPELLERAKVAVEINTRLTTFISIIVAGLSTVIITTKNNQLTWGIVILIIICFGLLVFYFVDVSNSQRAIFSNKGNSRKILGILVLLDLGLLAISYFTAPTIKPPTP